MSRIVSKRTKRRASKSRYEFAFVLMLHLLLFTGISVDAKAAITAQLTSINNSSGQAITCYSSGSKQTITVSFSSTITGGGIYSVAAILIDNDSDGTAESTDLKAYDAFGTPHDPPAAGTNVTYTWCNNANANAHISWPVILEGSYTGTKKIFVAIRESIAQDTWQDSTNPPDTVLVFDLEECQNGTATSTNTVTQTITQTVTQTITETPEFAYTETATPTITETITQTVTHTVTQTVTQTNTSTIGNLIRNITVTNTGGGSCYNAGQDITVNYEYRVSLTNNYISLGIIFSNNSTPAYNDDAVWTSEGPKDPPNILGHYGGWLNNGQPVADTEWHSDFKVVKVPSGYTAQKYVHICVKEGGQYSFFSGGYDWTQTFNTTMDKCEAGTPTFTHTITETITQTITQTVTQTITDTITETVTETHTETATVTPTATATPTPTPTFDPYEYSSVNRVYIIKNPLTVTNIYNFAGVKHGVRVAHVMPEDEDWYVVEYLWSINTTTAEAHLNETGGVVVDVGTNTSNADYRRVRGW